MVVREERTGLQAHVDVSHGPLVDRDAVHDVRDDRPLVFGRGASDDRREREQRRCGAVTAEYDLLAHHVAILQAGCEALDRQTEARVAIDRDGAYVVGRFGPKAHPALAVERDARLAMVRCLRELGLDFTTPDAPRAPGPHHER